MKHRFLFSFCTFFTLSLFATTHAADWPMWRYDAGRTAASPHGLPKMLYLQWEKQLPALSQAWEDPLNQDLMQFDKAYEPIVVGKTLILGSNISERITAIDTETGKEKWRFYTNGPVRFPAVARNGRAYCVSDDGFLYCLDIEKGTLLWKFRGGPTDQKVLGNSRLISMWPARGGPVIQDNTVYFAAGIWPFMGIFIHALDAETGSVIWTNDGVGSLYTLQPHNSPAYGSVAPQGIMVISGDKLLVPGGRSVPACFDRNTGEFLYYWNARYNKTGGAFVCAIGDRFINYHRDMVTSLYQVDTGERVIPRFGNVPVATSDILYCQGDTLSAFSLKSLRQVEYDKRIRNKVTREYEMVKALKWVGDTLWKTPIDASGDLIKAGNVLYAGGKDILTAIDISNPNQPVVSWQLPVSGQVARLVAADDKLFIVTLEGKLITFGAKKSPLFAGIRQTLRQMGNGMFASKPALSSTQAANQKASDMLKAAKVRDGYALIYSKDPKNLSAALLNQSDLYIIAVTSEAQNVNALRQYFDKANRYGNRITIQSGTPETFNAPPYMASLIACDAPQSQASINRLYQMLRPYGGTAYLASDLKIATENLPKAQVRNTETATLLTREGALPGAANWTHQYGNVANTVKSDDQMVKLPLGVLWFGGSSNVDVLPRHGHGPPEQVVDGRLIIEGMDGFSARDVYTGRVLWKRTLPQLKNFGVYYDETYKDTPLSPAYNQIHIPGANARGTNYVATSDGIYIALEDHCLILDPATGDSLRKIDLPKLVDTASTPWGYIGIYKDFLIAGTGSVQYTDFLEVPEGKKKSFHDLDLTASKNLVVFNRLTGDVLWTLRSKLGFRHNAIVAGADKVFCIDRLPDPVDAALKRRGHRVEAQPKLLALDIQTGEIQWQTQNNIFGTWLSYSAEYDVLLQAGRKSRDMVIDEVSNGMTVYRAQTGEQIWTNDATYGGPCILHHDTIITDRNAFHLLTGKPKMRRDPLTGKETPWAYSRRYGCNYAIASEHLITFRSATGGFYDLANDGGTGNFGGFKSGCTSNLIAANGVLNAPDYTRTCSCAYPNQTSLALVHMPNVEQWVTFAGKQAEGEIRNLGINLGAPGNRRADDGRFWLAYPLLPHIKNPERESGLVAQVSAKASPNSFYTHHASTTSGSLNWVAASGCQGLERLEIDLNTKRKAVCKVDLVFSEPEHTEAGERVFDIQIEGQTVQRNFDIVQEAGAAKQTLIKSFNNVTVSDGSLTIDLTASQSSANTARPILSGVSISVQN